MLLVARGSWPPFSIFNLDKYESISWVEGKGWLNIPQLLLNWGFRGGHYLLFTFFTSMLFEPLSDVVLKCVVLWFHKRTQDMMMMIYADITQPYVNIISLALSPSFSLSYRLSVALIHSLSLSLPPIYLLNFCQSKCKWFGQKNAQMCVWLLIIIVHSNSEKGIF